MLMQRADIAQRIPHQGAMCLLDGVLHCDAQAIACSSMGHLSPENPLRDESARLGSALGVEYAAQAVALHCALAAAPDAPRPRAGYLSSVRDLELLAPRLDATPDAPLHIHAQRLFADGHAAMYHFEISAAGQTLLRGRLGAVLDTETGKMP